MKHLFDVILERKFTVWVRNTTVIEANSLEEAKQKAKEMYVSNDFDCDMYDSEEAEVISETLTEIDTITHDGEDTHQLFVGGEIVDITLPEVDYDDDPAFDHLRDEEANFIDQQREQENG